MLPSRTSTSSSTSRQPTSEVEHRWRFHDYTKHKGQVRLRKLVARPDLKTIVAVLGRRWGKTTGLVELFLHESLKSRIDVGWFANVKRSMRAAWEHALKCTPPSAIYHKSEAEKTIALVNGSSWQFNSLEEPDNVRGWAYHVAIIDEASRVSARARDEVVGPMLADHNGKLIIATTPAGKRGRGGHVYRDFKKAKIGHKGFGWLHGPTTENPLQSIRDFCREKRDEWSTAVYDQEILAKFLESDAVVLDIRPVCVLGGSERDPVRLPWSRPWEPEEDWIAGLDLGQKESWTVLTVLGLETRKLLMAIRIKSMPWKAQIALLVRELLPMTRGLQEAREQNKEPKEGHLFVDFTGIGGPVVEAFQDELEDTPINLTPVTFDAQKKQLFVRCIQVCTEDRDYELPHIAEYVQEADMLEEREGSSGLMLYKAAPGFHDDCVWSLGLTLYGARKVIR
jgi:hypothetical protein